MKRKVRLNVKNKVRLSNGLLDVLKYDMDVITSAVDSYDFITVGEYIRDVNETLDKLIDNLAEIEYIAYRTTMSLIKTGGEYNE